MPIPSPYPDVDIPDVTVFEYVFGGLTADERRRPAFLDRTGTVKTYGDLVEGIEALAGALAHRGVGPGDVVAIHAPNSPEFAVVLHGILRAGATATTVNALYTPTEVLQQLESSRARLVFTVRAAQAALAAELAAAGKTDLEIILIDSVVGELGLSALVGEGRPAPSVAIDPATHVAVLPYSSGTTGAPKGVRLSHTNLVANVAQSGPVIAMSPEDRILAVLPFFHVYGLTVLLNVAFRARAALAAMPRFELREFLATVAEVRCTYLFIAPPVAVALAKHPAVDEFDLSSVSMIMSGAAPLDEQLAAAVATRLGTAVGQGFGMSELSPVSHCLARSDTHGPRRSVGLALPNVTTKIVDPATGREVDAPGESGVSAPGELWVSGPNVMLGYLDNEEATAATVDADGYLHTGDLATIDADGYVTIVDRLKELIKYKGYQVPPAELEAIMLSHPDVADVAVVGVTDAEGEELPKAFVVPQAGASVTAEELIDFVAARVAPYKKVRQVEFIGAVPKSASGKILRRELRHA